MNKKALIFGGGAIAVVAIVVALIFIFTGGEDAYRSIKVFEIDGTCTVERDGDTLDAFKNMALSSGFIRCGDAHYLVLVKRPLQRRRPHVGATYGLHQRTVVRKRADIRERCLAHIDLAAGFRHLALNANFGGIRNACESTCRHPDGEN